MELYFKHNGTNYSFNTSEPIDISLAVKRDAMGTNCFYTQRPQYTSFQAGSFIGNVSQGGACNVDVIVFTPHGNGTHTECIGHINSEGRVITDALKDCHLMCELLTVLPEKIGEDYVISSKSIGHYSNKLETEAIIIRTLPNTDSKKTFDYSGTNPVYFAPEVLQLFNTVNIKHLICDIPSVDKEDDGGLLKAHKAFFGEPGSPRLDATITELVFAPSEIEDGLYMLNLQIASFQSDASPSRPLLYKIKEKP
jgi:arylformamidase